MRKIKFRAWDKTNKKMIISFAHVGGGGRMYTIHHGSVEPEYEVMQYTGLKDKNGKEIYEGDIIRHTNDEADHTPYEVPPVSPENWEELLSIGDGEWDEGGNQYSNIEVIGNIYQNPELLKEAK